MSYMKIKHVDSNLIACITSINGCGLMILSMNRIYPPGRPRGPGSPQSNERTNNEQISDI